MLPATRSLFASLFVCMSASADLPATNLQGQVMMQYGQRIQTIPGFSPQFQLSEQGGEDSAKWAEDAIKFHKHPFGVLESLRNEDSEWPEKVDDSPDLGALRTTNPTSATVDVEEPYNGLVFDAAIKAGLDSLATNLKVANFVTANGIRETSVDPKSNWPPYFAGIVYVKANFIYRDNVL